MDDVVDNTRQWKYAWVTGASKGIGRAVSMELCRMGVNVYASARNEEELNQLSKDCQGCSGKVIVCPLDISDQGAIHQLFTEKFESNSPDLYLLNAGTHDPFPAQEFTAARTERLWQVNVFGTARCLEAVLQQCIGNNAGQIALMASIAGYRGLPTAAAYGSSKAALINLAESLKLDLIGTGVDVRIINPGFVRTPLTDKNEFTMPALMEPEEAAKRIVAGLQGKRFEITFPRRFAWLLKSFSFLPYSWYFPLVRRMTQ